MMKDSGWIRLEDSLSAIVERLREGSNANQDTISVSRSLFLGVHTVDIISSESRLALCHWNHFAKSRFDSESRGIYKNLTSEAEDTTHKANEV